MAEGRAASVSAVGGETSERNAEFWNEPCGSHAAKSLGVTDASVESLRRFDRWYFEFYPYLDRYISFDSLAGLDVLEVGLGYGSVAQRLAASGCNYVGLDIAPGPVKLVNHRLAQNDLRGRAEVGNILSPPFAPESFDRIVAIGCLHHTGDLGLALERCRTLLRPNGQLIFMVYSAYSYRRWWRHFGATARYLVRELSGFRGVVGPVSESQRAEYDTTVKGDTAPHTDFVSTRSLRRLCSNYRSFVCHSENIDREPPFGRIGRERLMRTFLPAVLGLDLYACATR